MSSKNKTTKGVIYLDGLSLTIDDVLQIARDGVRVEISPQALQRVQDGRKIVEKIVASNRTVYGINTGFGKLAEKKIDAEDLEKLQLNLIRSHAAGVGDPLSAEEVRAVMTVRLNTLLRGYSGVRDEIVKLLASFVNSNIIPHIPRTGSLGASGDLAPSAHLALVMAGEGLAISGGKILQGRLALSRAKLKPVRLKEKEGIAIINGTQVMSGLGCLIVKDSDNLLRINDIAAAASLDALGGNLEAFDDRIQQLRPVMGQIEVAARIRQLVSGSRLLGSGKRVQDPYSLRCIPQVHGAFAEAWRFVSSMVETEINAVTDNPLVFPDETVISAGNFHGQPVALSLDVLGIAIAEAGSYCERRIDKLLSGFDPELPLFLSTHSGLNSGMMILQYTAAALVNRNLVLATPAGLNTATVSAGQEDHASMGVTSALKAREILANFSQILAIELICACQALDFRGVNNAGIGTKRAHRLVRKYVGFLDSDRSLSAEIQSLSEFLQKGDFVENVFRPA